MRICVLVYIEDCFHFIDTILILPMHKIRIFCSSLTLLYNTDFFYTSISNFSLSWHSYVSYTHSSCAVFRHRFNVLECQLPNAYFNKPNTRKSFEKVSDDLTDICLNCSYFNPCFTVLLSIKKQFYFVIMAEAMPISRLNMLLLFFVFAPSFISNNIISLPYFPVYNLRIKQLCL